MATPAKSSPQKTTEADGDTEAESLDSEGEAAPDELATVSRELDNDKSESDDFLRYA